MPRGIKFIQFIDYNSPIDSIGDSYSLGFIQRNQGTVVSRYSHTHKKTHGLNFYLQEWSEGGKYVLSQEATQLPVQLGINCYFPISFFAEGAEFSKNYNFAQRYYDQPARQTSHRRNVPRNKQDEDRGDFELLLPRLL